MNWILEPDMISGSAKAVDLDGSNPPQTLTGDLRTIAMAVRSLVPFEGRVSLDVTGMGLALAEELSRVGVRVTRLIPQHDRHSDD